MCATEDLKELLHLYSRSESSFLSDGLEIGKLLFAKPRVSVNMRACLCHQHSVTMLTKPDHVDEQLKEWLKSQK